MTFNFSGDFLFTWQQHSASHAFRNLIFLDPFLNIRLLVTTALLHHSSISLLVLAVLAQFERFGEIQNGGSKIVAVKNQ